MNGVSRFAEGRWRILTNNPATNKPIYTEDELNIKLTYIYFYALKKVLSKYGMDKNDIRKIIDTFTNNYNSSSYSKLARDLVEKFPRLSIIIPAPEEGFDNDLVKGVKALDRFGAFN